MRTRGADDVELARRSTGGDGEAFAELFDRWFDRAFDVAWHIVRNRDTAADVAQETFATVWQGIGTLRRPESFGGWVLRIARNQALHRLAAEQRARPVGDEDALVAHDRQRRVAADPADPVTDRERDDLVWAAAAALGDDDASILGLHLRHGLTAGELADELGVAPNAAHQRLFRLRKRLGDAIGAWALWQLGHPRCDDLRRLLAGAGTTRFDRDAAGMITAHARGCPDCDGRRALRLSPEAMFAATPLVAAGPAVKAEAAAALTASGTPASASPTPGPAGRRVGRSHVVAAASVVAAGVVAAVLVAALRGGEDAPTEVAGASAGTETSTTAASAPSSAPSSTAAPTGPAPVPTSPAGTAPPGPDPEVVAPTPATSPTTTTSTTTRPPVAAPVIGGFRATPLATGNCATPGQSVVTFVWDSTGATSARLGPTGGAAVPVDPSGTHTACAAAGSTWALTVTNEGGRDTATAGVP